MNRKILVSICLAATVIVSCSDDPASDGTICDEDQLYDQRADICVDRVPDDEEDAGYDASDSEEQDADIGSEEQDADVEEIDPDCDKDGDGELSIECGGYDCDDNDPERYPGRAETCNYKDNNCDGIVNSGLDCTFYGHTYDGLYSIDPFAMTANRQADLEDQLGEEVGILDIDTHPSGTLYGITREEIYAFYDSENYWIRVAQVSNMGDANGLAIDNGGIAYVTAENHFFAIDLGSIEAQLLEDGFDESQFNSTTLEIDQIQITGGEFYSSGDCVVNKQNTFYMSSKHVPSEDYLVEIDRSTGAAESIGPMGIKNVFGLTAGWGTLYGTTSNGELVSIDPETGETDLLHIFDGKVWFGTASTPAR